MLILTEKFIVVCVIATCATKIYATPNKKYFRNRFVTPNKCPAHPDDCEILERSGFHSEEDNSDCKGSSSLKSRSQKDVAKAQINLRFPRERRRRPRKEIFISSDSGESGSSEEFSPQKMRNPSHQPEYESPYMFPFVPPYSCPYYFNPFFMYPPPITFYPPYEDQSLERKKNFDFNQNIFQIVKRKKNKGKKLKKPLEDVPHVYIYKKKKDGTEPTSEEIRNESASSLTEEDIRLINKFIEKSERSNESSEEESDECFCPVKRKPRIHTRPRKCRPRTTPRCIVKPTTKSCPICNCTRKSTKCPKPSTTPTYYSSTEEEENKTTCSDRTTNNPLKSTTTNPVNTETSSDEVSVSTCSQFLNTTTSPQETTYQYCTTKPPRCKYNKNVILKKIVKATPCTDRPRNRSSCDVSDMIKFIKIRLCDMNNSYYNCSNCDCSSEEEEEDDEGKNKKCNKKHNKRSGRIPLKDMDELYYTGKCSDPIPYCPYYNPYFNNVYPWGYPENGPYFPTGNPRQCEKCFNRNTGAFPPKFNFPSPGCFEQLNWLPPWIHSGSHRRRRSSCKKKRK